MQCLMWLSLNLFLEKETEKQNDHFEGYDYRDGEVLLAGICRRL